MDARIVVIDNDESMRALVTSSLNEKGWQTVSYDFAHMDLTAVVQHRPDLVILDFDFENVGMMWEFLQLLKMEDETAKIPILITSVVYVLPPEVQDYLLTRHITVVHKSYDLASFIAIIEKTLIEASQSQAIFTADRTLPILLVDDTEDLRDAISTVLRFEGYHVVTAYNGRVALDHVSQADYALILLDLDMPVMNGYEFLKAYNQQPRPHAPVIILTANQVVNQENLTHFVVHVLGKPFENSQLIKLVTQYADPV